jgi:hypothetical protein
LKNGIEPNTATTLPRKFVGLAAVEFEKVIEVSEDWLVDSTLVMVD